MIIMYDYPVENKINSIYNNDGGIDMKKTKLTEKEQETEKDKEFDKRFGKYVGKPMSKDEFKAYMDEVIKFYEQ